MIKGNGNLGVLVSHPRDLGYHLLCPVSTGEGLRSEFVLSNLRVGALLPERRLGRLL